MRLVLTRRRYSRRRRAGGIESGLRSIVFYSGQHILHRIYIMAFGTVDVDARWDMVQSIDERARQAKSRSKQFHQVTWIKLDMTHQRSLPDQHRGPPSRMELPASVPPSAVLELRIRHKEAVAQTIVLVRPQQPAVVFV